MNRIVTARNLLCGYVTALVAFVAALADTPYERHSTTYSWSAAALAAAVLCSVARLGYAAGREAAR